MFVTKARHSAIVAELKATARQAIEATESIAALNRDLVKEREELKRQNQTWSNLCERYADEKRALYDELERLSGLWRDVDLKEVPRPTWPKIKNDPIWNRDLKPWFQGLLTDRLKRLMVERDHDTLLLLQAQALMLEGLIAQPEIEENKMRMIAENMLLRGDLEEANANGS